MTAFIDNVHLGAFPGKKGRSVRQVSTGKGLLYNIKNKTVISILRPPGWVVGMIHNKVILVFRTVGRGRNK